MNASELRWRAFAEYVAQGKSATQSYKLAGYKAKNDQTAGSDACRMPKKPRVQEYLAQAVQKASNLRIFGAAERREVLRKIALGEVEQEITTTSEGPMGATTSTQTRRPTAGERTTAIAHLDKLDGLMVEKHEHAGPDGTLLAVLAEVSTDTLMARLAELAERSKT